MGKTANESVADDIQHGLIVIVWARWSIVIFAFIMRMYRATEMSMLVITIIGLMAVALVNFALHASILAKRSIPTIWVYLASIMDICLISLIVGLDGGLNTHIFLYFYPAVLGFALVFPGRATLLLTLGVLAVYSLICIVGSNPPLQYDGDESILIFRLLSLIGVAVVGNRYRFVESYRRAKAAETRRTLQSELKRRSQKAKTRSTGGSAS